MPAYYNDSDPQACAWARELIKAGLVPDGEVDERPIQQVDATDLRGFVQCHFFCGILGWAYALRLAGWPDDRPVWTGSCPCQPYSAAGKGLGDKDPRNLWPEFFRLVRECRPVTVFGEQVEGAVRHGWLDGVSADLEGEGYAVGAVVLGAHSVGAPHIRQRLYWVAHPDGGPGGQGGAVGGGGDSGGDAVQGAGPGRRRLAGRVGDAVGDDLGRNAGAALGAEGRGERERGEDGAGGVEPGRPGSTGFWSGAELIPCRDGKARRVEPGIFPVAPRLPGRVALLRGAGNSIVPQAAAEFIRAYLAVR